ncbi:hypothetical protein Rctr197k_178 [Virus Rctr197k]|nr:hypothetical protein Rctr197k_178 [Virus Rctr197k]
MALIIDPDNLSQGTETAVPNGAWGSPTGAVVTITSGTAALPVIGAGDYFEVRDHSQAENNGLYLETGGTPTTSSITATKQTGTNPVSAAAEAVTFLGVAGASTEKSVHIDTGARHIWLIDQGNLSTDGVLLQTVYSFLKEEWKNDAALIRHPFPLVAITPEQFEIGNDGVANNGWTWHDVQTRKRLRTGGWRELQNDGDVAAEWAGVISLGSFEDSVNDQAYYQQGNDPTDTAAATNFTFSGPVNEAIETYNLVTPPDGATGFAITGTNTITRNDGGSWLTEGYRVGGQITGLSAENAGNIGTFTVATVAASVLTVVGTPLTNNAADTTIRFARNFRNALSVFLRVRDGDTNGKTYAKSTLTDIGVTTLQNQAYRFPLSNASDLKISETDANIAANSPYTQILVRYLSSTYNREVDSGTPRNFGVVIDVGTYSQSNGVSNATTLFTSAALGVATLSNYTGGTLTIHEGADAGVHTISGTPVDNAGTLEITLTVALTGSASGLSFTMQRATPVSATAEEIYEKVQYLLRQAADVDSTTSVVTGRTADALLRFVGDTAEAGQAIPSNPNGGGNGVIIEGFDANDTNRLTFYDNSAVARTYPFVAAGTITFNSNLQADTGPAVYRMFFTYARRTTVSDVTVVSPSGFGATLHSAGAGLPTTLIDDEFFVVAGLVDEANNGIWRVNDAAPDATDVTATKIFPQVAPVAAGTPASATLDEAAFGTPDAIIVNDNAAAPISGNITGPSVAFTFDYDNNTQGGRTAATDAAVTIVAVGQDRAQYVTATGTITRNVGLTFVVNAALERNYSNP